MREDIDRHYAERLRICKLEALQRNNGLLREDIDRYYAERLRICKLEALLRAEDYVDSIIVNRINLNIMNGRKFPDRPVRPPSPGSILLDDTTVVAPIFKR